jgi:hypothetical protein
VGDVDAYLAGLPSGATCSALERLHRIINCEVPGVGQTTSYSMPCYTYRGRPVAAIVARKNYSDGTLRFTESTPLDGAP